MTFAYKYLLYGQLAHIFLVRRTLLAPLPSCKLQRLSAREIDVLRPSCGCHLWQRVEASLSLTHQIIILVGNAAFGTLRLPLGPPGKKKPRRSLRTCGAKYSSCRATLTQANPATTSRYTLALRHRPPWLADSPIRSVPPGRPVARPIAGIRPYRWPAALRSGHSSGT
jgi:hypothetical protein